MSIDLRDSMVQIVTSEENDPYAEALRRHLGPAKSGAGLVSAIQMLHGDNREEMLASLTPKLDPKRKKVLMAILGTRALAQRLDALGIDPARDLVVPADGKLSIHALPIEPVELWRDLLPATSAQEILSDGPALKVMHDIGRKVFAVMNGRLAEFRGEKVVFQSQFAEYLAREVAPELREVAMFAAKVINNTPNLEPESEPKLLSCIADVFYTEAAQRVVKILQK